jgi:ABC-type Zn uptake system ZnuABC Zn-binding protein ZnuA
MARAFRWWQHRIVWLGLLACLTLSLVGCGQPQVQRPPLKVVATLAPIADWARQVGQQRVTVTQIVPDNVDPFEFKPSARDLQAIAEADVLLYNGLGVEGWLEEAVPEAKARQIVALELAQFIGNTAVGRMTPLRPYAEIERNSSGQDELDFFDSVGTSPYLWLDPGPGMAQFAVQLIADTFTRADSDSLLTFRRNAERYNGELEVLDGWIRRQVRDWPLEKVGTRNALMMQVPDRSWHYFAQRYGINLRTFDDDDSTGQKPEADLPLFVDQFADRSEYLAVLGLRQPDGVLKPLGDNNYIQMMRSNVMTIANGLQQAARRDKTTSRRLYDTP